MNKTNIVLKGIRADEMSFKLNNVRPQEGKLDLKPTFSRKGAPRRRERARQLRHAQRADRVRGGQPQTLRPVRIRHGHFRDGTPPPRRKSGFAVVECTQLLFPYLRSAVTNLTTAAMSAPVVLPVVSGPLFPEDRKLEDEYFS